MSRPSTWLLEHRRNVYSQTGEDGVIEKILEIIPRRDNWCVEFGAWDGLFLTNTRHLIESKGYSAVLIEASQSRFRDLQRNYAARENIIPLNRFVGFRDDDNLDRILTTTPIPQDFDLLSIDIDGNDYHVWKAFSHYRPKVVVIEFNPTIPTHLEFVQPADPVLNQGSSLLSIVKLAKEKGYELVSALRINAFFVRSEYLHLFELESNAPEVLRTDLSGITYLFSGYDGHIFLRGCRMLPWHGIELRESRFQQVPRLLQSYPGNFTRMQKGLLALLPILALLTRPSEIFSRVRTRLSRPAKGGS